MTAASSRLSNAQLEILKLFSENLSEKEMEDLRQWLQQFRYRRLQQTIDKLWEEKGWTSAVLEEWSKTHLRTPYKSQAAFLQKQGAQ